MSGNGREALPDVRECRESPRDVREWYGGPPGCEVVICMPTRISGSGRVVLLEFRECSGGTPGSTGVVGRTSRMSGSGRRTSVMSGSGREAQPDVREWSGGPSR